MHVVIKIINQGLILCICYIKIRLMEVHKMTLKKLTAEEAQRFLAHERHNLRKLRQEMEYTRNPDTVQRYIDFSRLSIICEKRGYMYFT